VQAGLLTVSVGGDGTPKTFTLNVPGGLVQPLTVAVTEYIPVAIVPAPAIVGFCKDEVNEFGPVQLKVAPPGFVEVKLMVDPAHKVAVPPAVGAAGVVLMTTAKVPAALLQPKELTVKEYTPAASVVAPTMVGF
jgi:hypothetical protein